MGLGKAVHIIAWRYIVKLIIREYTRDRRVQEVVDDEHRLGIGADDFQDRQFAHGRRTGGWVYGWAMIEALQHTVYERDGFRRVSVEWHRFLGFVSTRETNMGCGRAGKVSPDRIAPEICHQQVRR